MRSRFRIELWARDGRWIVVAASLILLISCTSRDANRQASKPAQENPAAAPAAPNESEAPASPSAIGYFPASLLRRAGAGLAQSNISGRTIYAGANYHVVTSRRVTTGEPEVHDDWMDVTFVEAGHAVFLAGGQVNGGRLASPGEHRGGRITAGEERPIATGDVFVVPAGVPHQFRLSAGDSIRYVTIKVPRR